MDDQGTIADVVGGIHCVSNSIDEVANQLGDLLVIARALAPLPEDRLVEPDGRRVTVATALWGIAHAIDGLAAAVRSRPEP